MNYAERAQWLVENAVRGMSQLLDELEELAQETARSSQAVVDQAVADERLRLEREQQEENQVAAATPPHVDDQTGRSAAEERERQAAEAREQREAIARSMAARRSKNVVAPIDEEDEEAQYYQRKSWLV
ncbi:hypothetical protein [Nocardia cyriacigeorgica]|uniref:hypothetical protein n=1 Tax=Nocardia cyriacigeorgica TaxID=135487 RepID=UPI0018958A6E|nr:hypothetical protein [Nocardia cyriacigeorgica]MBF6425646.1 hypothetical protein [Nocardia cyriacigeorgica]